MELFRPWYAAKKKLTRSGQPTVTNKCTRPMDISLLNPYALVLVTNAFEKRVEQAGGWIGALSGGMVPSCAVYVRFIIAVQR